MNTCKYDPALPNVECNIEFDTTKLKDGIHTLEATACDEAGNCGTTTSTFVVDNHQAPPMSLWLILVLAAIVIGTAVLVYLNRNK